MKSSESDPYERLIRRVGAGTFLIGVAGAVAAAFLRGWRAGLGFALGSSLSYLSFWRWRKIVDSLSAAPKARSTVSMVIRFMLLAGVAYAIVKYLEVNPAAVFLGLLTSAAAVIVAIVFELIYART